MSAHRRYQFPYPADRGRPDRVRPILDAACAEHHWFSEPEVTPEGFAITVTARDRWWAHRRAMRLAVDCFYAAGLTEAAMTPPTWTTLPPHTNRGRYRKSV